MDSYCPERLSNSTTGTLLLRSLLWVLIAQISLITSCSTEYLAPLAERSDAPQWRPQEYQIRPGDTLYSIAWEFGLDFRDLARWNNLSAPHKIITGHRLTLAPQDKAVSPRQPVATTRIPTNQNPVQRTRPTGPTQSSPDKHANIQWQWPTEGKVIATYSPELGHNRGLNIAGKLNQPIIAAAAGSVVYAGEGLKAYGKMIIIKHSDRYLSAYANNQTMKVREGQKIQPGQTIATMGHGNDGKTMLHFEIRRDGKPVDPQIHLPKRG